MSSIVDPYFGLVDLFLPFDGANALVAAKDVSLRNRAPSDIGVGGTFALDTSQSKFGGSSGRFSPASNYYPIRFSALATQAVADFTVEMWVRVADFAGGVRRLFVVASAPTYSELVLYGDSYGTVGLRRTIGVQVGGADVPLCSTAVLAQNTWYHVAWVRQGTTTRLYLDGVLAGSTTTAYLFAPNQYPTVIGTSYNPHISLTFNGWMDDLRLTNGIARYTADFTPPGAIIDYTPNNVVARADTVALNTPRAVTPPAAPRLLESPVGITRNVWTRGNGRVAGTVKEASTPADLPLRRIVRLVNQRDGRIYGETWSDAATGEYVFENIDETQKYFVISHDHTANYNAVVKDGITPEAMP